MCEPQRGSWQGLAFFSIFSLSSREKELLATSVAAMKPGPVSGEFLAGRGGIGRVTLDDGRVGIVKGYFRGGIPGALIRETHFRIGSGSRARNEMEMLRTVINLGIRAPEPLICMEAGRIWYRNWLVTLELADTRPLTWHIRNGSDGLAEMMSDLTRQVRILVEHGILHVDLHPGNVLVDADCQTYLIDFDKTRSGIDPKRARRFYEHRWLRAFKKYGYPMDAARMLSV